MRQLSESMGFARGVPSKGGHHACSTMIIGRAGHLPEHWLFQPPTERRLSGATVDLQEYSQQLSCRSTRNSTGGLTKAVKKAGHVRARHWWTDLPQPLLGKEGGRGPLVRESVCHWCENPFSHLSVPPCREGILGTGGMLHWHASLRFACPTTQGTPTNPNMRRPLSSSLPFGIRHS